MSEWVDRAVNGKIERIAMRDVRKGDRYRISTESFEGPWRVAAADASLTRNTWTVADVRKNRVERRGTMKVAPDNAPRVYTPDPRSKRPHVAGASAANQLLRIEDTTLTYKELARRYNQTDSQVRVGIKRARKRNPVLTWANLDHFLKREQA